MADLGTERVAGRLGEHDQQAVLLADGLELVLGEVLEIRVEQQLPELVQEDDEPPPVDERFDAVEQIHDRRRPGLVVVDEVRHVKAEDRTALQRQRVLLVVEQPAQGTAPAPAGQTWMQTVRVGGIQELQHRAEPPLRLGNPHHPGHRLANLPLLCRRQRQAVAMHQFFDEGFQEQQVSRRGVELERRKARRDAVLDEAVLAPHGPHADGCAQILVEHDIGGWRPRLVELLRHGQQRHLQHGLARPGLADDQGIGQVPMVGV